MVAVFVQQLIDMWIGRVRAKGREKLTQVAARPDTPEPTTAIFIAVRMN